MEPPAHAPKRLALFDALRNPHFRWFWIGRLASSATMQMGGVAQGWLVYELTGSAAALAWVSAGWSIATSVLSLFFGTLSDRMEKRHLLLWSRLVMLVIALGVTALIATGLVQVWHLAAYSLLRGIVFAFMMPAQNAYLAELVDRKTLMNAISLNSVGMGLAGIVFASLSGWMIENLGVETVYLGVAVLYGLIAFTVTRLPLTGLGNPKSRSVWSDLREGVKYVGAYPILISLLSIVAARGFLGMPYRTFMPKYAQDVMGMDAQGLGLLTSAPGWGSLASSLILASLGDYRGKGKLLLIAGAVMGGFLLLFSNGQSFLLVYLFLIVVGAASNTCMVTNQALLQECCSGPFRGRVMSMYMMMFGIAQLATIPAGAIADQFGVSIVIGVQGTALALFFVVVWFLLPKVRRLN